MKPSRLYVSIAWWHAEDEEPDVRTVDCGAIEVARAIAAHHAAEGAVCQIRERRHLRDVTPQGDPRGILWNYDDELLEEP